MKFPRPAVFAAGAVTALVLGSGTAVAATGGKFLLGKANSANSTTTLKNPKGTPLQLTARAGKPALKVNTKAKIPNLNADVLDGVDSRAFALASGQTNTLSGFGFPMDLDEDGTEDVVASIAMCPPGTRLTGGGGDDYTPDGGLAVNSPLDNSTWLAVSRTADMAAINDVIAYAVCYNPRGAVRGDFMRTSPEQPSAQLLETVRERLAPKMR